MKVAKGHPKQILPLLLVFLALTILPIYYFTDAVHYVYYINWGVLAICLLTLVVPAGKVKIVESGNKLPLPRWLANIFLFQVLLFFLFIGVSTLCGQITHAPFPEKVGAFNQAIYTLFFRYALFPWPIYTLFAGAFGIMCYRRQKDCYLSDVAGQKEISSDSRLGSALNSIIKMSTIISLAMLVGFGAILIASLFSNGRLYIPSGMQLGTMIFVFLLVVLLYTRTFKNYMNRLLDSGLATPLVMILVALFIAVSMLIFSYFTPANDASIALPKIVVHLQDAGWFTIWTLFSASWWLAWAAIAGIFLAHISRGYSLRAMVLASLLLPAGLMLALYLKMPIGIANSALGKALGLIGFVGVLFLFFK